MNRQFFHSSYTSAADRAQGCVTGLFNITNAYITHAKSLRRTLQRRPTRLAQRPSYCAIPCKAIIGKLPIYNLQLEISRQQVFCVPNSQVNQFRSGLHIDKVPHNQLFPDRLLKGCQIGNVEQRSRKDLRRQISSSHFRADKFFRKILAGA
jgi:hypothetical protein